MSDRPTHSEWEGPLSYRIASDGFAYEVGVLGNPDHIQGEWVKLDDYRDLERKRDEAIKSAQGLADAMVRYAHQRDAYAETMRLLRVECYDFIDQRHPELAQEATESP